MTSVRSVCTLMGGLLLAQGCGGGETPPAETAEEASAATEGGEVAPTAEHTAVVAGDDVGPPKPWEEMTHEEQGQYMNDVVLPEMAALFQGYDAEAYADMDCSTCHGDNAREVGFEMPNGLPALMPSEIPGYFQSDDEMDVFMTQTVWPRMTALLGMEPYDPETHQGFSCLDCHETAPGG